MSHWPFLFQQYLKPAGWLSALLSGLIHLDSPCPSIASTACCVGFHMATFHLQYVAGTVSKECIAFHFLVVDYIIGPLQHVVPSPLIIVV